MIVDRIVVLVGKNLHKLLDLNFVINNGAVSIHRNTNVLCAGNCALCNLISRITVTVKKTNVNLGLNTKLIFEYVNTCIGNLGNEFLGRSFITVVIYVTYVKSCSSVKKALYHRLAEGGHSTTHITNICNAVDINVSRANIGCGKLTSYTALGCRNSPEILGSNLKVVYRHLCFVYNKSKCIREICKLRNLNCVASCCGIICPCESDSIGTGLFAMTVSIRRNCLIISKEIRKLIGGMEIQSSVIYCQLNRRVILGERKKILNNRARRE